MLSLIFAPEVVSRTLEKYEANDVVNSPVRVIPNDNTFLSRFGQSAVEAGAAMVGNASRLLVFTLLGD